MWFEARLSGHPSPSPARAAFRPAENGISNEFRRFARLGRIDRSNLGSIDLGVSDDRSTLGPIDSGVVGPTNVTLDGLRRVSMNLRDETSPLEATAKPVGVLQAASRWSVTDSDRGEPARAVATVSSPVQSPRRQWPI